MGKAFGSTGIFGSILLGAIIWFVLQVIIGVIAWVSIVAGGVVAAIGVLFAIGVLGARAARQKHHDAALGAH
jgi:TM2 domain-containing membrane protein YozV